MLNQTQNKTILNKVIMIGRPNSGKSLLFNRLTGMGQKVSNFPGITVELKEGAGDDFIFCDFPGVYSLEHLSEDERVSLCAFEDAVQSPDVSKILFVVDITKIENAYPLSQTVRKMVAESDKELLVVLNMKDELSRTLSAEELKEVELLFGASTIQLSAKKDANFDELFQKLRQAVGLKNLPELDQGEKTEIESASKRLVEILSPLRHHHSKFQRIMDNIFLSPLLGGAIFVFIMAALFQAIFTWSTPLMDSIEGIMAAGGSWISGFFHWQILKDFLEEAIFGGIGAFVVFVPQIFLLTFLIGIMEDSGYLARAALVSHRPLSLFGLSGKSFVPLLTGHACAIPAIYAARAIQSPRRRLVTQLVLPLTACSARLPVYGLLVTTLIPKKTFLSGFLGYQGLAFAGLYLFGLVMAFIVSFLISKTKLLPKEDVPLMLELPSYRVPHWKPLMLRSFQTTWSFLRNAGPLIFCVTGIVWALGYFPHGSGHLGESYLASFGQWIEPLFAPIGLDWKFGVAVLASFLAREVFVGTLGTLLGIEAAGEDWSGLSEKLAGSGLSFASGVSLLVFYAVALQCISTVAVLQQETGRKFYAWGLFFAYAVLAYILAFLTYQFFSI